MLYVRSERLNTVIKYCRFFAGGQANISHRLASAQEAAQHEREIMATTTSRILIITIAAVAAQEGTQEE
jgi:hypothetical protein